MQSLLPVSGPRVGPYDAATHPGVLLRKRRILNISRLHRRLVLEYLVLQHFELQHLVLTLGAAVVSGQATSPGRLQESEEV